MKITNIRTKEVITNFVSTPSNYLVKCPTSKYATHIDEAGNYYCMYGVYAAYDGEDIIILNNK